MVASLLSHGPVRRANKLFSDNIDYRTIGNHATTIDTGGAIVRQNRGSSWGILAIIRYLKISVEKEYPERQCIEIIWTKQDSREAGA